MVSASAQGVKRYDAEKLDAAGLKLLNTPIDLGSNVSAPNVFLKAAMTERLSSWDQKDPSKRGIPSEELVKVYEQWGRGGFGIILSGNTMVNQTDLEAPGNPTFPKDGDEPERLDAFKRMASGAKANGSLYIVQLSHAGRQVAEPINPNPVSASDVKLDDRMGFSFAKPAPLTLEGIKNVVDEFASAAEYAFKTGADGIQLHSSHGYLLSQFLAPSTNKRTDQYGGSLENRSRIIFEIVDEIKKRIPTATKGFVLGIKINSMEFQEGGFQPEECRDVIQRLADEGMTFFELSGGTYESLAFGHKRESTKKREAFFLEFSDIIVKALPPTAKIWVTGGFRTAPAMASAIQAGSTHGIGLARPVTVEFDLPKKLLSGEVSAAIEPVLDENDFGTSNMISGTQMRQVGREVQPFDSSDEPQVKQFQSVAGEHMKKAQELGAKGVIEAGYPVMN